MTWVNVLGWTVAVLASVLGVPQVVRLIRTRSTAGVARITWQAIFAANIGWGIHGWQIGAPHMVANNVVAVVWTLIILGFLIRDGSTNPILVLAPSVVGGAALALVGVVFGSAAFGIAALGPAILANTGQTVKLVHAPRVDGVSPVFLAAGVLAQVMWIAWGTMVRDAGTVIGSSVGVSIVALNLTWWFLRRGGLRPLFAVANP